ncbi:MAG: hypothetical protein LBC76_00445 [Treponema sp.]|jgi:hypothetical protein|nr:hypothetical protein [Treponema sp.]
MKELSPKSVIFAVFCMVILASCVPTGGATEFVSDPKVQDFVNEIDSVVYVIDLTGDNLKGRDGRIEGLNPNKYYMVEKEVDADGNNVPKYGYYYYPVYATDADGFGPGGLYPDLGYITKIRRGTIFDLANHHSYTVRAAEVFSFGTSFTYENGSNIKSVNVDSGGAIFIPVPSPGDIKLNIPTQFYNYNVIAVAAPTITSRWNYDIGPKEKKLINGSYNQFRLEDKDDGSTVDYVFVKNDYSDFKVLKVIIEKQPGALSQVNQLSITQVPAPVAGVSPVNNFTSTQYNGNVVWSPTVSGTFAAGTTYTATITLTVNSGYTFQGVAANAFNVTGATSSNAANSGVITADFSKTADTVAAAITQVTAPVAGASPVNNFTNTQYDGGVVWSPTVSGTFAAGTTYTATITLTPKTGYTLYGVTSNFFTLTGATSVSNSANSGVITAVFPATLLSPNGITITFTFNSQGNITANNSATINRSTLSGGSTVNLSLDLPTTGSWSNITWHIGGLTDTTVNSHKSTNPSTPDDLVINNSDDFFPILGPASTSFRVTVTADLTGSTTVGEPNGHYSATIRITVGP